VGVVTGLHGAHRVHGRDVGTAERPVVVDVLDARAALPDHAGELRQAAGSVADGDGEPRQASPMHEPLLDDAAQDRRVDIPPAHDKHNPLAFQLGKKAGYQRGKGRRGGALHDDLLELQHPQYGQCDPGFLDTHHLAHALAGEPERRFPDPQDSEPVRFGAQIGRAHV
jgi:hypothetical protein